MAVDSVVGIIGWPVSHSLSPIMHTRAFLETGLSNWVYVPMPVKQDPGDRLKEAVLGLRALGFKGANVTVPYKEAVIPFLDGLSDTAKAIGAVNTIAVEADGRLIGHNTDGLGFVRDLKDHGINSQACRAMVLGAGGSARAIVYALLSHGCKHIVILNRTKIKALKLASSFQSSFPGAIIEADDLTRDAIMRAMPRDLIINATSLGLKESEAEMPWFDNIAFRPDQVAYDIIYNPKITAFLRFAAAGKAKIINGLGMLVHQGALSFTIWTGQTPPIAAMKEAASSAL